VPFDSLDQRRMLVEWYAPDTAQEAVTAVLAALIDLLDVDAENLGDLLLLQFECRARELA
jgi:hypothetical protein